MKLPDGFSIRLATTEPERRSVFQLRYEINVLDLQDHRYTVENTREWRDALDELPSTRLLMLCHEENLIGTQRWVPRADSPFLQDALYDLEGFAAKEAISLEALYRVSVLADRAVLLKAYRGTGIYAHLTEFGVGLARAAQFKYAFGAVASDNPTAVRAQIKQGFEPYLTQRYLNKDWACLCRRL